MFTALPTGIVQAAVLEEHNLRYWYKGNLDFLNESGIMLLEVYVRRNG
jgi:hypothetical protein